MTPGVGAGPRECLARLSRLAHVFVVACRAGCVRGLCFAGFLYPTALACDSPASGCTPFTHCIKMVDEKELSKFKVAELKQMLQQHGVAPKGIGRDDGGAGVGATTVIKC